jgi:hypothetical protein
MPFCNLLSVPAGRRSVTGEDGCESVSRGPVIIPDVAPSDRSRIAETRRVFTEETPAERESV